MTLQNECNYTVSQSWSKKRLFVPSGFVSFYFCCILFAFLSFTGVASGQGFRSKSARNAVYTEFASRGPVYSINYDRIFRQGDQLAYSFSAGFSIAKNAVSCPLGIHFITGINDHHAEFGVTFIPYIDYKHDIIGSSSKTDADKYLYINPGVGYRYQKRDTGVFLKAAIGPSIFLDPPSNDFWSMDPKLYAYGSIGVGISF